MAAMLQPKYMTEGAEHACFDRAIMILFFLLIGRVLAEWQAELPPKDKIACIENLKKTGCRVLMVCDGINDAPALAAADVSLSPVTAARISQAGADALFMSARLPR
jgi:cation transport ATPase